MQTNPLKLALLSFLLSFITSAIAEDWPQWRGPDRDGISKETGLLKEWPEGGPKLLWKVENAGVGYSSIAVSGGRIFTMGDLEGVEHILAFNESDGSLIWAVQPEPVQAVLDERITEQFRKMDQDQNGQLDDTEAMKGLGGQFLNADREGEGDPTQIAAERASKFLAAFDQDGNGSLGPKEIPSAISRELSKIDKAVRGNTTELAEKRTANLVSMLDGDSDGKISQKEARGTVISSKFRNIDRALGQEDKQLSAEELNKYFSVQERGRDGMLSGEELEQYFAKFHPGRDGVLRKADLKRAIGGYRNGMGDGPRGTPLVIGNRVYTEGGNGDVTCLDAETGKTIWHVNLTQDFEGRRPGWGYSESPLAVDDLIIVTPGGKGGTVVALKQDDGSVAWRSNAVTEAAHYASAVVAEIAGKKQIVQFARENVFGIDLENGEFLWKYDGANNGTANCTTPIVEGDFVLTSSAYGTGTGLAKVSSNPEVGFKAEEVYFAKELQNHHGGLVKLGEYVYGFSSRSLICMNFMTGKIAWEDPSVKKGSLVYADGHLYCLGEGHEVALVEATPEKYIEKGRFSLEKQGRPAWAHPVVVNGRFYIRDQHTLACYDVSAK